MRIGSYIGEIKPIMLKLKTHNNRGDLSKEFSDS